MELHFECFYIETLVFSKYDQGIRNLKEVFILTETDTEIELCRGVMPH